MLSNYEKLDFSRGTFAPAAEPSKKPLNGLTETLGRERINGKIERRVQNVGEDGPSEKLRIPLESVCQRRRIFEEKRKLKDAVDDGDDGDEALKLVLRFDLHFLHLEQDKDRKRRHDAGDDADVKKSDDVGFGRQFVVHQ